MVDGMRAGHRWVRPGLRRVLLWVGPVLLAIIAWQIWDAIEMTRVDDAIARVFPEGGIEPRGSSEEDDAARYYVAASSAVVWPEDGRFQFPGVAWGIREALADGRSTAVAGSDEAVALIARNDLSLDLIARGRDRPFGAFRPGTEFNYRFSGLLQLAQVATLQTLEAVRRGDGAGAGQSLIARMKLLRVFEAERRLIGAAMLSRELQGVAVDIGLLLARARPSDAVIDDVSRGLAELDADRADGFIAGESAGRVRMVSDRIDGRLWTVGTFLIRPVMRHSTAEMLQVTADARQAVRLPWPDRIAAMDATPDRRSILPQPSLIAPDRLRSGFRDLVRRLGAGVAAVRCARLAVAIEQQRRSHGGLPERLTDIKSDGRADVLGDPFTGRPLQYVRTPNGYVLYSTGPDGVDDGGKIFPLQIKGRQAGTTPAADVGVTVKSFPSN